MENRSLIINGSFFSPDVRTMYQLLSHFNIDFEMADASVPTLSVSMKVKTRGEKQ